MTADGFIAKWETSGGNERANTHLFITDLCTLLGVESPRPTQSDMAQNDYVFERNVIKTEIDGTTSNGWIDCYKRDSFILEAKQGSQADIAAVDAGQGNSLKDFFGQTAAERFKRGMAKRGTGQWTGAMQKAAGQAEGYAKALPKEHGWPPFLLVSDIGHCIDVYADFSRSGKGYAPFPDRKRFRVTLEDLRDEKVRERLKAVWENPMSLDPSAEAARVTREIAGHLATLARRLESRGQNPDRVAAYLMRLLFTMFAEDSGLIPRKSFSALLKKVRERPENLVPQLSDLWAKMDKGGFVGALGEAGETVRRFNGYLFKETSAIALEPEEIDVLIAAAKADWRQVEPAIFGTLLERALNVKERAKLGAHYTPRAYVERLVQPTIMEPLKEDWLGARTAATEAAEAGDKAKARKIVEAFHGKLARTKVLDPACGTGNFLYVAMARMKELEGEALELLEELGDDQYLAEISGHTITPENFLGIEINPRAAAIAQLVLWIGYLQWHFKVNGEERMPEPPILRDVRTIENRDALIEWDERVLERDESGLPKTVWDGSSMKLHPVTGKLVPDDSGRKELYRYVGARKTTWPKADFIVGNPPFIGNKRMRERLGEGYTEAVRRTYSKTSDSIDFVMYWWSIAAGIAAKRTVRRFGFITTNSISQTFNRSIIEGHTETELYFAIPDHPWIDATDGAAVRIAMTVGGHKISSKKLLMIVRSETPSSDGTGEMAVTFDTITTNRINADLTAGVDFSEAVRLKANTKVAFTGMYPLGAGFILNHEDTAGLGGSVSSSPHLKAFSTARDLTQRPRRHNIIDFFPLSEREARDSSPILFQWVLNNVKPERDVNPVAERRRNWWLFTRPIPDLRAAIKDLRRFIAVPRTTKFFTFQFIPTSTIVDTTIVAIASDDAWLLGVLSSQIHAVWAEATGGRLGVGNDLRYQHQSTFLPFPFPATDDEALKSRIREAAEKLDGLRKEVLERHPDLTLTRLYNTLEALRAAEAAGGVLSEKERDIATRGCVSLIRHYHDAIDAAVAEAYGWEDWVNPPRNGEGDRAQHGGGGPGSSPASEVAARPPTSGPLHQPSAGPPPRAGEDFSSSPTLTDETILERLVALNKARAGEEAKGQVRWLRKDFQAPDYVAPAEARRLDLGEEAAKPEARIIPWPGTLPDQVVAVAGIVDAAGKPVGPDDVARAFKGKRASTVRPVLDALAGMGRLRKLDDGRYAA